MRYSNNVFEKDQFGCFCYMEKGTIMNFLNFTKNAQLLGGGISWISIQH